MSPHDILALFRDELPDPDLELYSPFPVIVDLSGFRRLPPSVKQMIWNLVRGRTVLATLDKNGVLHTKTPPPITLRICHESRLSTLPFYQIPAQLGNYSSNHNVVVKSSGSALHLHFFDPKIDTLVLQGRNPSDISCYFQYCTSETSEDLGEIKSLQVKRFDWAMLMFKGWKAWSEGRNPHFTYFRCFRGLEKLIILGGGHGLRTEKEQEECKAALIQIFEDFNETFAKYNVPKVQIKMA